MKQLILEISFEWVCRVCGNRYAMLTDDGNEEWAMCCDRAMKMQPMKKLMVGSLAQPTEGG